MARPERSAAVETALSRPGPELCGPLTAHREPAQAPASALLGQEGVSGGARR